MWMVQVDEFNPPWRFFTSCHHDPMLYGYRGLIVEWNYTSVADCPGSSAYRLNGEDEASFPYEVDVRPDDFHRHYCPYRRLVGAGVVERFNRASTSEKTSVELRASSSLAEFVRRLQGSSHARDQIQPVYRPVTVLPTTDYAVGDQRTGSHDDWYAMVDRVTNYVQEPSVMSEYPTTSKVGVVVTPSTAMSNPLPVVPEVSVDDKPNGNGTEVMNREPVLPFPVMNGNGKIDHYVREPEVADDVRVKKSAETSTNRVDIRRTTVVRHVNGDAVNVADDDHVSDVTVNGSDHRVMCTAGLADDGADAVKTSTFGYIIDEASRRTIRSDL